MQSIGPAVHSWWTFTQVLITLNNLTCCQVSNTEGCEKSASILRNHCDSNEKCSNLKIGFRLRMTDRANWTRTHTPIFLFKHSLRRNTGRWQTLGWCGVIVRNSISFPWPSFRFDLYFRDDIFADLTQDRMQMGAFILCILLRQNLPLVDAQTCDRTSASMYGS